MEQQASEAALTTTLLIDGDIECFKAACTNQESIDWGDDGISVDTNAKGAEAYLVSALTYYMDFLKADRSIICLTGDSNWRKEYWPEYKVHRKDAARPLLLEQCKKFLADNYETECWHRLEADDVMGILSSTIAGSIIVSVDKDMRTIPCRLFNPDRESEGVVIVDDVEAHEWHMTQTLTGDATDGYKGCPGIGPKKAQRICREVFDAVNPIQNYSTWRSELWKRVVKTYEEKGLSSEEALLNARMAYILRFPREYNRKTAKLKPWCPPA